MNDEQIYQKGDFVAYNFNNGHGPREKNGRVIEIISDNFVKIDDDTVPKQSIIEKITVNESDFLEFDTLVNAAKNGEKGSAQLFANLYHNRVIYDHTDTNWYFWNDSHWELDKTKRIINTVSDELSAQYAHALSLAYKNHGDDDWRVSLLKKVLNALNYKNSIQNILTLATAQQELSITGEKWGCNPWLLGVANGVVDLKAGDNRAGEPEDYIRDVANTLWQGDDCPAPRWEQFLDEIFNGDRDKIYFLQRVLGYSLIGMQIDHILPILCGADGRNGKTVLLNILRHTLGPYITPASEEILLSGKKNPGAATPFLVMLQNKRIAYISETDEGARLDAGTVKQLTGNDTIIARNLYGKPFTFEPSHTILLITNHTPHANSDDEALWERVVLLEFTERFVDNPDGPNEHKRDPYLMQSLESEVSGILAWLVRGCKQWQKIGMKTPSSVKIATEMYRQGEDDLGKFIGESCELGDYELLAKQFYAAYRNWAGENGINRPMSSTAFGKRMTKRFQKGRQGGTGKTVYIGLKLSIEPVVIRLND